MFFLARPWTLELWLCPVWCFGTVCTCVYTCATHPTYSPARDPTPASSNKLSTTPSALPQCASETIVSRKDVLKWGANLKNVGSTFKRRTFAASGKTTTRRKKRQGSIACRCGRPKELAEGSGTPASGLTSSWRAGRVETSKGLLDRHEECCSDRDVPNVCLEIGSGPEPATLQLYLVVT